MILIILDSAHYLTKGASNHIPNKQIQSDAGPFAFFGIAQNDEGNGLVFRNFPDGRRGSLAYHAGSQPCSGSNGRDVGHGRE